MLLLISGAFLECQACHREVSGQLCSLTMLRRTKQSMYAGEANQNPSRANTMRQPDIRLRFHALLPGITCIAARFMGPSGHDSSAAVMNNKAGFEMPHPVCYDKCVCIVISGDLVYLCYIQRTVVPSYPIGIVQAAQQDHSAL